MRFGIVQSRKFGTLDGAYSEVTDREHYDSQITLTDFETELLLAHFGAENIHVGPVRDNPSAAKKMFSLYPAGEDVFLNVVYPKLGDMELRLYISQRAGFKPHGGEIWFMFLKEGRLWIGSMPPDRWCFETSVYREDPSDDSYQGAINETDSIYVARLSERDVYARDRSIALERMELSGYRCEYDESHGLFVSRYSDKPFLEAHHLVPMSAQGEFPTSLDILENIFCLCPVCHRAVHHAEATLARDILTVLSEKRNVFDSFSLGTVDLHRLYSVEKIQ